MTARPHSTHPTHSDSRPPAHPSRHSRAPPAPPHDRAHPRPQHDHTPRPHRRTTAPRPRDSTTALHPSRAPRQPSGQSPHPNAHLGTAGFHPSSSRTSRAERRRHGHGGGRRASAVERHRATARQPPAATCHHVTGDRRPGAFTTAPGRRHARPSARQRHTCSVTVAVQALSTERQSRHALSRPPTGMGTRSGRFSATPVGGTAPMHAPILPNSFPISGLDEPVSGFHQPGGDSGPALGCRRIRLRPWRGSAAVLACAPRWWCGGLLLKLLRSAGPGAIPGRWWGRAQAVRCRRMRQATILLEELGWRTLQFDSRRPPVRLVAGMAPPVRRAPQRSDHGGTPAPVALQRHGERGNDRIERHRMTGANDQAGQAAGDPQPARPVPAGQASFPCTGRRHDPSALPTRTRHPKPSAGPEGGGRRTGDGVARTGGHRGTGGQMPGPTP
ncbi:hypothetical protein SAMN05421874_12484 [Nonomuraea maritima]|uniref:Uncharacterized protein n=1 Tax=Nonomuraea maritima TaxID=683260 RepID=A0A1G9L9Z0_9ACTN|nr:hypothetical protein SAMN05421874_12484 [Nonomuraea maritima]